MKRRLSAEAGGTGLLLYLVVGSGIAVESVGIATAGSLLANALTVGLGLGVAILLLQPVSGSHFNPAVSIGFWRSGQLAGRVTVQYTTAQLLGATAGVVLANLSFGHPAASVATTSRRGLGLFVAEVIGTLVLVVVILGLVRTGRAAAVPWAVGAWVAAIVFGTASTGFANPAVTISRIFTQSAAGIAPHSVPVFLAAQLVAALAAAPIANFLFPDPRPSTIDDRRTDADHPDPR